MFSDGFLYRSINQFVGSYTSHYIGVALHKSYYSTISQATCKNSVSTAWGTTSLMCPRVDTLISNSGNSSFVFEQGHICYPVFLLQQQLQYLKTFRFLPAFLKFSNRSSILSSLSGIRISIAPVAIPLFSAMKPASRPITSTKNTLL